MTRSIRALLALLLLAGAAVPAAAQTPSEPAAAPASAPAATTVQDDDPDRDQNNAQPDFYVATLPTNLRVPRGKMVFRMTHRFAAAAGPGRLRRPGSATFSASIPARTSGSSCGTGSCEGGQIGIYRTSDSTIQFSGQYKRVAGRLPARHRRAGNGRRHEQFQRQLLAGVAVVLSREIGDRAAIYLQPAWINNTNPEPTELVDDNDTTVMSGVGTRVRVRNSTYLVLEASPRVAGYKPGVTLVSFGIEQRLGGHLFQLNFSNGLGTTLANVARGGTGKRRLVFRDFNLVAEILLTGFDPDAWK